MHIIEKITIKFTTLLVLLLGSLACPLVSAAVSHAYIVDANNGVRYVSSDGKTNEQKSEPGFALMVSVGGDGSVWVISTDQGSADTGGNLVKVLKAGQSSWTTVTIQGGIEAVDVSGDINGGAYIIDGDTHNIVQINSAGAIVTPASSFGAVVDVSAAFSDTNPSSSQIWAISGDATAQGNPVYYLSGSNNPWRPRGISAYSLSGYWLVQSNGQVVTAASDGGTNVMSPPDTATSISVGRSGSIWVVSGEPNIKQGGSFMKFWNEMGTGAENWVTVPNLGARSVSVK